jgi:Zn-finger nucleic acid-binding protein
LRDAEGLVVATCPSAHGVFVRHAVLRELRKEGVFAAGAFDPATASDARNPRDTGPVSCPACGEAMKRVSLVRRHELEVDVCTAHGVWFDAGELRGALRTTPPEARPGADPRVAEQARAALDVSLALEEGREEETLRRATETADDLLDTINFFVFGRGSRRSRY